MDEHAVLCIPRRQVLASTVLDTLSMRKISLRDRDNAVMALAAGALHHNRRLGNRLYAMLLAWKFCEFLELMSQFRFFLTQRTYRFCLAHRRARRVIYNRKKAL
jgi:hypothetical protein